MRSFESRLRPSVRNFSRTSLAYGNEFQTADKKDVVLTVSALPIAEARMHVCVTTVQYTFILKSQSAR